jgi:sulfonate transport system permease protein
MGTILGVFSGVVLGSSRTADRLLSPTVGFLAGLPVVVWMPFWIVLLGSGEGFKIGLTLTATYFLVHIHTFQAVRVVGVRYIELAEMYEKSLYEKIESVRLTPFLPRGFSASLLQTTRG